APVRVARRKTPTVTAREERQLALLARLDRAVAAYGILRCSAFAAVGAEDDAGLGRVTAGNIDGDRVAAPRRAAEVTFVRGSRREAADVERPAVDVRAVAVLARVDHVVAAARRKRARRRRGRAKCRVAAVAARGDCTARDEASRLVDDDRGGVEEGT